jgi:hypothetical protein
MNRSALYFAVGLVLPVTGAVAQSSNDLTGAWSLVSLVEDHGGKLEHPFGEQPNGMINYDRNGMVMVFIASNNRPKSSDRPTVPVGPSVAYYGTYALDGNNLTAHVKGSTYPNFEGTDQKGVIAINGDNLKLVRTITGGAQPFTSPSVPMTVRHRPPWSLDPMGRKDDLAHAHGSDAERRY